jgi:hypothetical protein
VWRCVHACVQAFRAADDLDLAFIDPVIPHYAMAPGSSKDARVRAGDDEPKVIAQPVIADQQRENNELTVIRASYTETATPEAKGRSLLRSIGGTFLPFGLIFSHVHLMSLSRSSQVPFPNWCVMAAQPTWHEWFRDDGNSSMAPLVAAQGVLAHGIQFAAKVDTGPEAAPVLRESWHGQSFAFCSESCHEAFRASPARILPPIQLEATGAGEMLGVRSFASPLTEFNPAAAAAPEARLEALSGVEQISINPVGHSAKIVFDPATIPLDYRVRAAETRETAGPVATTRFAIEEMDCGSCVSAVKRALIEAPGVVDVAVNPATAEVTIVYQFH